MTEPRFWRAPWTDEQCRILNEFQVDGRFHPYTCGTCPSSPTLIATRAGWRCPYCGYRQDWAHEHADTTLIPDVTEQPHE
ncbi:MAG TPA: hypothetical protein VLH56_19455 [Dissulfurispiraceae bacterium]|nr:hypothetical protein [Dissulfurispiraceae bacterium]